MSKSIKDDDRNENNQDVHMQMDADENEEDENLDLQNGYESSDKDQLKENRHEDERV